MDNNEKIVETVPMAAIMYRIVATTRSARTPKSNAVMRKRCAACHNDSAVSYTHLDVYKRQAQIRCTIRI